MISLSLLLFVAAFVLTLVHAAGKCPLWVPVLLVILEGLIARLG